MKRHALYATVFIATVSIWCGFKLHTLSMRSSTGTRSYDSMIGVFTIAFHDIGHLVNGDDNFYCWTNNCNKDIQTSNIMDKLDWILAVWPWYTLMVFGCYCLYRLGKDIVSFNDYPEEIKKLEKVYTNMKTKDCTFHHFYHLYLRPVLAGYYYRARRPDEERILHKEMTVSLRICSLSRALSLCRERHMLRMC